MNDKDNTAPAATGGPATKADLLVLLGKLIATLHRRLDAGDVTAAELQVCRQLLADNEVKASAAPGTPLGRLVGAAGAAGAGALVLPFAGGDMPRVGSFSES